MNQSQAIEQAPAEDRDQLIDKQAEKARDQQVALLAVVRNEAEFKKLAKKFFEDEPYSIKRTLNRVIDCFRYGGADQKLIEFFKNLQLTVRNVSMDQEIQVVRRAFRRNNPTFVIPLAKPQQKNRGKSKKRNVFPIHKQQKSR